MVIGIDYRLAVSSNRGMARYCREIVHELMRIDNVNEYILYVTESSNMRISNSRFRLKIIPFSNYMLSEQLLTYYSYRDHLDVLWSPYNTFPFFLNPRTSLLVTIHDLIFIYNINGKYSFKQLLGKFYRKYCILLGRKKIDTCFTVSLFSKTEIERRLGIDNVFVTYNCIDYFVNKMAVLSNNMNFYESLLGEFYFTLSGDAPSKNLCFLIEHFEKYEKDKKLFVSGVKSTSFLRKESYKNVCFLEDNISDEKLIAYYRKCKCFIFMSLYEGFGIPVLEALICGAKVISSNRCSLPEVLGECGLLIDPTNHNQLSVAMKEIENWNIDTTTLNKHLNKFIGWRDSAKIIMAHYNK